MPSARPIQADPFPTDPGPIGRTARGLQVSLAAMTVEAATPLGSALAAIDPWARAGYSPDRMAASLARVEPDVARYRIIAATEVAGVMVVRRSWLHGPYLQLLGLLPEFHGQYIGGLALVWLQRQSQDHRNLWLCCSEFNCGARRFYERHGFEVTATVDSLVFDGANELLMRKRLVAG